MKQNKIIYIIVLALVFLGGQSAWAQDITVSSSTVGSTTTFTITRSGSILPAQTVRYRTVSLSAFQEENFTAVNGSLSFSANETSKTVTVTEKTPASSSMFRYSAGTSGARRVYRFEVLDLNGFLLAACDRSYTVTNVTTSALGGNYDLDDTRTGTFYNNKVSPLTITHDGYANNPHDSDYEGHRYLDLANTTFYDTGTQNYLVALGNTLKLHMSLEMTAAENEDGYQYVQVLTDNTSTCDSGAGSGDPGDIGVSRYMAGFEIDKGDVCTENKVYTFPILSAGNNEGATNPWGYGNQFNLIKQKFNTNCRASDGSIVLNTNFTTLVVRLNASGSGGDNWLVSIIKAYVKAVDGTAPGAINDKITVSPGPYNKGNQFYISVPFSEIVIGAPTLNTTWGDATYVAGTGTNVLTFQGTIEAAAGTALSIDGYTGNAPRDLMENELSGVITKNFDVTSAESYSFNVFQSPSSNVYNISSKNDLASLAGIVNNWNNCEGKTFLQTQDIACSNTFTPIGVEKSSNNFYFKGTYDGQGHTISGISVTRTGTSSANDNFGLFGYIGLHGLVKNVVLASCTFAAHNYVGGIVGELTSGTVQNCRVESTVIINAGVDGADYHGGITGYVGANAKIFGCFSAATVSRNSKSNCEAYGGIAGYMGISEIKHCLYTGTNVNSNIYKGAIIGHMNSGTLANNYYTDTGVPGGVSGGDVNGARFGRVVTLGANISPEDSPTIYDVSGITAYGDNALSYDGTLYSGEGQTLNLAYTGDVPSGYSVVYTATNTSSGLDVTADVISGSTLTMPDYNVTVASSFALATISLTMHQGVMDGATAFWGSFYDGSYRYTLPEGATAYTIGTDYKLYRLGTDGRTIPAGVAVVIVASSANVTLTLDTGYTAITDHALGGNILLGSDSAVSVSGLSKTPYVLSVAGSPATVAFRQLDAETIPARKAYYLVTP